MQTENIWKWLHKVISVIAYLAFDLKPECLYCVAKQIQLTLLFQNYWRGLYLEMKFPHIIFTSHCQTDQSVMEKRFNWSCHCQVYRDTAQLIHLPVLVEYVSHQRKLHWETDEGHFCYLHVHMVVSAWPSFKFHLFVCMCQWCMSDTDITWTSPLNLWGCHLTLI